MTTLPEQARAEAEKRVYPAYPLTDVNETANLRSEFEQGFLAGHEATHADEDARIVRLIGVVTATTMLGPQDAEAIVRAFVAHAGTRQREVTTVAELNALPVGSVVMTEEGWLAKKFETTQTQHWDVTEPWSRRGNYSGVRLVEHGPLTVLHEPED